MYALCLQEALQKFLKQKRSSCIKEHVLFLALWKTLALLEKYIFVLSSLWEGFGYVLAESMLASVPMIAFDCNSMPELVTHGENGLLVTPPKSDAEQGNMPESGTNEGGTSPEERLANAVEKLMQNESMRREMGINGRERAIKNYAQERCMDKLEGMLLKL